jgi:hypothetical protein
MLEWEEKTCRGRHGGRLSRGFSFAASVLDENIRNSEVKFAE